MRKHDDDDDDDDDDEGTLFICLNSVMSTFLTKVAFSYCLNPKTISISMIGNDNSSSSISRSSRRSSRNVPI